jgi:hypothetical protein
MKSDLRQAFRRGMTHCKEHQASGAGRAGGRGNSLQVLIGLADTDRVPRGHALKGAVNHSVAVGLIAGSGPVQKMHLVVDDEIDLVCHFPADARNAPSCNHPD